MPVKGSRGSLEERFWVRVSQEEGGCWLWQGRVKANGYGTFSVAHSTPVNAHRWSYERFVGPIPEGMELDHLCRVRSCVNPQHLEVVDHQTNMRRAPVNGGGRFWASRDHCHRGHAFDVANTRMYKGARICRACKREGAHARTG